LAFIVPSEYLNANFGEKIKEYLLSSGVVLHLININFKENVFDNAITTSSIILAQKSPNPSVSMNFYNVFDVKHLDDLNSFLETYPRKVILNNDLDPKTKWRIYFNGYTQQINNNLVPFLKFGRISRGIATGSNEYFTLTPEEIKENNIPEDCLCPCITKANYVRNMLFSREDFNLLVKQNKKTYLFDGEISLCDSCVKYIKKGESEGINNKYLTKNRNPWYAIEKRDISKIWVSVFGRKGIRFIWNNSDCKTLTCFHSFYPTDIGKEYLDLLFIYLNTPFAMKLFDREKREYGNGLEKYEPNDINKSCILDFEILEKEDILILQELQKEILQNGENKKIIIIKEADAILNKY
jgi:adenine-specific DNA-methyltransferase